MINLKIHKKRIITISAVIIIAIGLPTTIWLISKNSDNRSRASGTTPTITMASPIADYPLGLPLPIDITIESGGIPITVIDIKFKFNPLSMQMVTFLSNNALDTELTSTDISQKQQEKGEFHYHAVETLGKNISGTIKLGQIIVTGKTTEVSKIEIVSAQIGTNDTLINISTSPLSLKFSGANITNTTPTQAPASSITPLPTVTNTSGQSKLTVKVAIPGIGSNIQKGENQKPIRTNRSAKLQIYNIQKTLVKTIDTTLTYTPSESIYKNTVSLGNIPEGQYLITINTDNTLPQTFPSTIPLSLNNTSTTTTLVLRPGDLDGDGELNMLDYTQLIGCIKKTTCNANVKADFNEDGNVNIYDFNIMIHSLR